MQHGIDAVGEERDQGIEASSYVVERRLRADLDSSIP
jgi:hypothetical protein